MQKVILITGTNSGFGKLAVKSLSVSGHKVYAAMRNSKDKNASSAAEMNAWNNVTVLDLDVTSQDSVNDAIATILKAEGKLDVLVNNAGVFTAGVTETFSVEDLEKIFDVNVKGAWRMMLGTLPQFRKQGEGLIVNISSGLGRFSAPFMTIYNSSKFALEGLVEGTYGELRGLGIDNVLIQPGVFPTTELSGKTLYGSQPEIASAYGALAEIPLKIGEALHGMVQSGQAPNPQLVADAIVKLVETEKGKRPLRTVVDTLAGNFTETANKAVWEEYQKFLAMFHISELVN